MSKAINQKSPIYLINLLLAVGSTFFCLLLLEGGSRIFLESVDFLMPELRDDEILGVAIEPGSAGHDSWGYRNKTVPQKTDIVSIGDSQTYGVQANSSNSWPSILQRVSKKNVYNLSLGGYSPVQYFHLLTNKARSLDPSLVIIGFYYGNDLLETYKTTYARNYWKHLRSSDFGVNHKEEIAQKLSSKLPLTASPPLHRSIRTWLAQNSVAYRAISFSVIGDFFRTVESQSISTSLPFRKNDVYTTFTPNSRLKTLDLEDPKIQEGLRISLELFSEMNVYCKTNNIKLLVVLIPTKERVYSKHFEKGSPLLKNKSMNLLILNEEKVDKKVKSYFAEHIIPYVDVLPALQELAPTVQIYPSNKDGHPNHYGYKSIAETIQEYLVMNDLYKK